MYSLMSFLMIFKHYDEFHALWIYKRYMNCEFIPKPFAQDVEEFIKLKKFFLGD